MTDEHQHPFDDRYVRFREHADLRERVTELAGAQAQTADSLRRIETLLTALNARPAASQPETAAALALHRALDAFDKRPAGANNLLSYIGVFAIGAVGAWVVLGLNL